MIRSLWIARTGLDAQQTQLDVISNNLANVNTAGFRADYEQVSAAALSGIGYPSRVLAREEPAGSNFASGPLMATGRKLDLAIRGDGFFAVQTADGKEAYTRAGNVEVDAEGRMLVNGRPLLGEGGELTLPEHRSLSFGNDGTVSVTPPGGGARLEAGRIKLVQPETRDLVKGEDGLFRLRQGGEAESSDSVVLASGYLEGSNVNAVDELVNTMALTRNFELQVRMMKSADEQARLGAKLVSGQG